MHQQTNVSQTPIMFNQMLMPGYKYRYYCIHLNVRTPLAFKHIVIAVFSSLRKLDG